MSGAFLMPLVFGNVVGAVVAPSERNPARAAAALACGAAAIVAPHFIPENFPIVRTVLSFATMAAFFRLVEVLRHPDASLATRLLATAFPVVGIRTVTPRAPELRVDDFVVGGAYAVFAIVLFVMVGIFPQVAPYAGVTSAMRTLVGGASAYFLVDGFSRLTRATFAELGFDLGRLHDAPILSRSVSEFWSRRWNATIHRWLDEYAFRPVVKLVRRRRRTSLAMSAGILAAFLASAILHGIPMLVVYTAPYAASMAVFFVIHGFIVILESRLGVTRWPPARGHAWTLAIFALTAPLFVEPLLRAMGR